MVARLIGQSIGMQTKASVVTDDKPGANGIIGVQQVLNAPADGHTLLFTTMSPMVLNKFMFKTLPYDTQKDFIPVGLLAGSTQLLAVNSKQPFKNVQEVIDFAKREPMKLNYGYGTTVPQLAGSMFEQHTGAKFTFVPYKAHTAMVTALVGGEVDLTFTDTASLAPYIKSGQVRVLATTAQKRLPGYPNLPTLRELGINYDLVAWHGLFVKRGTPPEIVARLTELLKNATQSPEVKGYLAKNDLTDFFTPGPEAVNVIKQDFERWEKITRDAGVVPN
ncbi:Bug family tripartite tricarboxylate transporter substrate binding protein [Variovorax saccharolyticus]|uniref:Bug family tripartite tricarboxylate transporter substrate binding protein n=1 Tax=Variovorax saccharolyticus TaxID=3053516 RepID=UPI0025778DD9|nr:tripartite tricarboxylate transporter substrate binding protein [Variovorax sp. J22R187]MDM0022229.1 tripartite tricarboxylate transporter substrate binding protein [Variovorax sp. J22R187]